MMSLYDYLGKAGGSELGGKVNTYAQIRNQKYETKEIKNPSYTGEVFLYTEDFLDEYFLVEKIFNS